MIEQPRRADRRGHNEAREQLALLVGQLAPSSRPVRAKPKPAEPTAGNATNQAQSTTDNPAWANPRTERLVERWVPGGIRAVDGARTQLGRHRFAVVVLLLAAMGTAIFLVSQRPAAEPAPTLPAAISAGPNAGEANGVGSKATGSNTAVANAASATTDTHIVISVVGKVLHPGLVTLPNGARVADAVNAAGGVPPGTDLLALNLARRLTDGEQIYVGIPVPPGASADEPAPNPANNPDPPPVGKGGKGKKSGGTGADPSTRVDLNTATLDDLETLPGVGPATAQRILTWRSQHGSFNSISELRDVGGIGDAKFAKIQDLVTT